jgi:transposase
VDPHLLSPVQHRGETAQASLAILRSRQALVESRAALVNHVRGACKAVGTRLPAWSTETFARKATGVVPDSVEPAVGPLLEIVAEMTVRIRAYDRRVEQLGREVFPETLLLRQVKGVGPVTSLAYVLVLEDHARFPRSRSVGPYLGLVPGKDESGESDPQLRITKEGDEFLRSLLVNSAQYILGPFGEDCDLRRHGMRIAASGGKNARKRAAVAVARKLAVLLHALWRTGAEYEPLHNSSRPARPRAVA